jgi:hypothetical protein
VDPGDEYSMAPGEEKPGVGVVVEEKSGPERSSGSLSP